MNKQLGLPSNRLFTNSNLTSPGGTAELYLSGTSTKANFLASDGTLLGPTLTANGLGQLPNAYQDEATAFRLILKDKGGVQLDGGECPVDPEQFVDCIVRTAQGLGHSGVVRAKLHEWNAAAHEGGLGAVVGYRIAMRGEEIDVMARWAED